jgi:hypothetical protein
MPSDIPLLQMEVICLHRQIVCTIARIEWARTGLQEFNNPGASEAELPNNSQLSDENKLKMELVMRRLPNYLVTLETRLREAIHLFEKKRKQDRKCRRLRRFLGFIFCFPIRGNQIRKPISHGQALLDRDIYAHLLFEATKFVEKTPSCLRAEIGDSFFN